MRRYKKLILFLVALALVVATWSFISYRLSLRTLVISYENISSVSVYKTGEINNGDSGKPVAKITFSGQQIKIPAGPYTLYYDANQNYESRYTEINLSEKRQVVSLSPKYSARYLDGLLADESSNINAAIRKKYPKVGDHYTIQRGKLYGNGDWYGTILVYKIKNLRPQDLFKIDSLRIVLKKDGEVWVVKTDPPDISLSKYAYPDIPEDVLSEVNSLPVPADKLLDY